MRGLARLATDQVLALLRRVEDQVADVPAVFVAALLVAVGARTARATCLAARAEAPRADDHLVLHREGCGCLLYTSPSPRDAHESRMPSSA
eukprot:366327-Chlamydomonas_euryale.AAC.13